MIESLNTLPEPSEESTPEVIREFSWPDKNELLVLLCEGGKEKFLPILIALAPGVGIKTSALAKIAGCEDPLVRNFLTRLNDLIPGAVKFKKQGKNSKWSGTALTTWLKEFAAAHEGQTPLELQPSFIAEQKESQSE